MRARSPIRLRLWRDLQRACRTVSADRNRGGCVWLQDGNGVPRIRGRADRVPSDVDQEIASLETATMRRTVRDHVRDQARGTGVLSVCVMRRCAAQRHAKVPARGVPVLDDGRCDPGDHRDRDGESDTGPLSGC